MEKNKIMKKLLLIFLCLPIISLAQQTYVPDDNFEQELIYQGYDNVLDNYVITANINTLTNLDVFNRNISDLTGIEDFTALMGLACGSNNLTSLNVSQNTALTNLNCRTNQLTSLDLSTNITLIYLTCNDNQITNLNLSTNVALTNLICNDNQITSLNLSANIALSVLDCINNQLISLDIRNGNNQVLWWFKATANTNLNCIDVDNVAWSTAYWTTIYCSFDAQSYFSTNCSVVFGCSDLLACNYDSLANVNDSSCIYPVIWQQAFPICNGDSVIVGSSVYNTTGNYIDTLTAVNGCDSIVYTDVTSNFPTIWYQTYLICDGDSVAVGSSVYDAPGNYMDTLISTNGCDSIVQTYLMIDENTSLYDTLSVGASIVWNGISLNVSGDYSVTLINSVGCDSIVNLNLTVTTIGISDIGNNTINLVKMIDMLGQETTYRKNTHLFYIYDDGTVEKKIIIE